MSETSISATFTKKLNKVRCSLKAPKAQHNDFGDFSYRSAEDIEEAAKPLLGKEGLLLEITSEPVVVGEWHYMRVSGTVSLPETEETITSVAYAREPLAKPKMDESQVSGSTLSYATKYMLSMLFLVDDSTADPDSGKAQEPAKRFTDGQIRLNEACKAYSEAFGVQKKEADEKAMAMLKEVDSVRDSEARRLIVAERIEDIVRGAENEH